MPKNTGRRSKNEWEDRLSKCTDLVSEAFRSLFDVIPEEIIIKMTSAHNGPAIPVGHDIREKAPGENIADFHKQKLSQLNGLKGFIKKSSRQLVRAVGKLRNLGDELESNARGLDHRLGPGLLGGHGGSTELIYEREFEAMRVTLWEEGKFFTGLLKRAEDCLIDTNRSLDRILEGLDSVARSHPNEEGFVAEVKGILGGVPRLKGRLLPHGRNHPIEQWQSKLTGMPEKEEWIQKDAYGREKGFVKHLP